MPHLPLQGTAAIVLGYTAYLALSILAATLMYRYFEVPVIRYRDKLRQARA
jgi:peptidoglycan/LPS O-acetylase OafA/YrhL